LIDPAADATPAGVQDGPAQPTRTSVKIGRRMGRTVADVRETGRGRRHRRTPVVLCTAIGALGLAACGSATHFADDPRPATPVDLSVYVDNHHVSVSPAKIGAGPVILYVTNQASGSEDVKIESIEGTTVKSSGAINSGQTAQINVNLSTGEYDIAAGAKAATAQLNITGPRANADNDLLQP
jgi:hypothetical protein